MEKTLFPDSGNAAYLEAMYQLYLSDPAALDERWRSYFETLPIAQDRSRQDIDHSAVRRELIDWARRSDFSRQPQQSADGGSLGAKLKQIRVLQWINSYRVRGHQKADTDPLHRGHEGPLIEELELAYHGLSDKDRGDIFQTGSLFGQDEASLAEIEQALLRTYCGPIGLEYMHIQELHEKRWIQQRFESIRSQASFSAERKRWIVSRLVAAEGIERYIHVKYVGQKRFSLEGGESLIPMLSELFTRSASHGINEIVIGMAHRGRLNVLVNLLGKTPAELFSEFEGRGPQRSSSGDVKYHQGFSSDIRSEHGTVHLTLAFNPSHLEIVAPVVAGSVRARQERRSQQAVLPVVIHGDAAFAGQGVVMETLNMSLLRGYATRGTVHIIVNNQIGFTTSHRRDARSTYYCSDVGKLINAPIFHVNGDDPEAVLLVLQAALDYRVEFGKDVVIDMVCYRRHGHNEADEPAITQPEMYAVIRSLPTSLQRYSDRLIEQKVLAQADIDALVQSYRQRLEDGKTVQPQLLSSAEQDMVKSIDWRPYKECSWQTAVDTTVSVAHIQSLSKALLAVPTGFELHQRVAKLLDDRRKMAAGALPIDWGYGETMAYATLLDEGIHVRLSGQDSGRGTFSHRHAVLHNQRDGSAYVPLRNLQQKQGNFLVIDSPLSEEAVLAFEYGYASAAPDTLVLWEAQFGDFANGAQVVIDQFISSGESKWDRLCGLTMLLPHGYEGQGPEHSSARLERYLQLCAEENMQICIPTTPAQLFHLLRRQMIRPYRKPLMLFSPKSLLRHKLAVSKLDELAEGSFQTIVDDVDVSDPTGTKRLVFCSGKLYYDLLIRRRLEDLDAVAIIRVEQLYPFDHERLREVITAYPNAEQFCWAQEEPRNQGAWYSSQHHMRRLIADRGYLFYAGRKISASPASGYPDVHAAEQNLLVEQALGLQPMESHDD